MLFLSFLKWWYSRGFLSYLEKFRDRLKDAADFFSIRLLIRNFFSPFRQISAERPKTVLALSARIRAFFDYLLSCAIGAFVRFFILILGTIAIFFQFIFGTLLAVLWPLAPAGVVYCVVLFSQGVIF